MTVNNNFNIHQKLKLEQIDSQINTRKKLFKNLWKGLKEDFLFMFIIFIIIIIIYFNKDLFLKNIDTNIF